MNFLENISLVVIMSTVLFFSGCVSFPAINDTIIGTGSSDTSTPHMLPTSPTTTIFMHDEKQRTKIDPVGDFATDSNFNITGSTQCVVRGITDYPVGSELFVYISNEMTNRRILQSKVFVSRNETGPGSFSTTFDMKGNPPGRYRIILADTEGHNIATSWFNITSTVPYYKQIQINPVGTITIGKDKAISGTTDMPVGRLIKISTGIRLHSCPIPITDDDKISMKDKNGERTLCGGSCGNTGGSEQSVPVTAWNGTLNIWNANIPTTGWCAGEQYYITAEAVNWTNVTPATQYLAL